MVIGVAELPYWGSLLVAGRSPAQPLRACVLLASSAAACPQPGSQQGCIARSKTAAGTHERNCKSALATESSGYVPAPLLDVVRPAGIKEYREERTAYTWQNIWGNIRP